MSKLFGSPCPHGHIHNLAEEPTVKTCRRCILASRESEQQLPPSEWEAIVREGVRVGLIDLHRHDNNPEENAVIDRIEAIMKRSFEHGFGSCPRCGTKALRKGGTTYGSLYCPCGWDECDALDEVKPCMCPRDGERCGDCPTCNPEYHRGFADGYNDHAHQAVAAREGRPVEEVRERNFGPAYCKVLDPMGDPCGKRNPCPQHFDPVIGTP